MPQRHRYYDRNGRELSAREALHDGKWLRDGVSMRVPAQLRDSRFSDGARAFWDQNRDSLLVVDARRIGGTEGNRPGYRVLDNDLGRAAKAAAYAAYDRDRESAYRDAAPAGSYPYRASSEGTACTINGAPGVLVKEDGVLVCRPVEEVSKVSSFRPVGADARTVSAQICPDCDGDGTDDDGDDCETCGGSGRVPSGDNGETANSDRALTVDAVSANHQRNMAKIYQQISEDVSTQWRKR